MRRLGIALLLSVLIMSAFAQKTSSGNQIVTKKEKIMLSELSVLDPGLLNRIDSLSAKAGFSLNLNDGKSNMILLILETNGPDNDLIYVSAEKQFTYFDGIWGYFLNKGKLFVIKGNAIPQLFKATGKQKSFTYTKILGKKMSDGSIVPVVIDEINDSNKAIVFTYSKSILEFERIFENY